MEGSGRRFVVVVETRQRCRGAGPTWPRQREHWRGCVGVVARRAWRLDRAELLDPAPPGRADV